MAENRDKAIYGVTLVAALGVGVLIGRSACAPEPERVVDEEIVYREPDVQSRDLCPCPAPPDVGDVDAAGPVRVDTGPPPEEESLPEAPPPPDPLTRKKLLSWVRDRRSDLYGCRTGKESTVELTVSLRMGDAGGVQRVDINAPEGVAADTLSCLKDRMRQWSPPGDLVSGRREVVFGLNL